MGEDERRLATVIRRVPTRLPGLVLLEPTVHRDARGLFHESYRQDALAKFGIRDEFVQDNHSRSAHGVIRGLHLQVDPGQAKLVRCARGAIWDVAVDVRPGSRRWGEWEGVRLDDDRCRMLFMPAGFAHGFCVLSEVADVVYKCSSYYDPGAERTIAHDDPRLDIPWPADVPVLSPRDAAAPSLAEVAAELRAVAGAGLDPEPA